MPFGPDRGSAPKLPRKFSPQAVYDFAVLGGTSGSSIILKDASGGDATLPAGCDHQERSFSTPTALAGTGSPQISFGIESASTDMKTATAIASSRLEPLADGDSSSRHAFP